MKFCNRLLAGIAKKKLKNTLCKKKEEKTETSVRKRLERVKKKTVDTTASRKSCSRLNESVR